MIFCCLIVWQLIKYNTLMNNSGLRQELEYLKEQMWLHSYRYYVMDAPLISDAEYDQLMQRLREIEDMHPDWITPDSPSQRVGAEVSEKFARVRHPRPILSLASAADLPGVQNWFDRIYRLDERVKQADFTVEPKIDGLTVVLHYRNGIFVQGATRGDGEFGEDITANLKTIGALPLRIPVDKNGPLPPPYLVVRGEAFIMLKDFDELNQRLLEAGERTYLNPRNTAAGSLRQLDPQLAASRPLTLLTYAIIDAEGNVPQTQWESLQFLVKLGFPVGHYSSYCKNFHEVMTYCETQMNKREEIPFEVDGIVIKINDMRLADNLGWVGKDPRGALALKYPAREVTTTLKEIRVNVGRTGVLTPYAVLEPVNIGGVIVKQATLHNFDYIAEKDIRVGDRVMVKRAGDVIPYVIGPVIDARPDDTQKYKPPDYCPACSQPVQHLESEVAWYCVNAACPAQVVRNLEHFVSRPAMDISGSGIKIVAQLAEAGLVSDVADLYTLKKEDLLNLEGFADKKAQNLLEAIDASRHQPLSRLINALGIRGIGEVTAADLARKFTSLEDIGKASVADLLDIEGIGSATAESIIDWFNRPANKNLLKKLMDAGINPKLEVNDDQRTSSKALDGCIFVVTGTLPNYSRDEIRQLIEKNGGKVTDSISKNTSYLVVGDNAGSKLDKAQKLGIPILDEAELLRMID